MTTLIPRHAAIRDVLLNEWDPIGIAAFAGAENEYDAYVSEVDFLLIRKAPIAEIFAYLWRTETQAMALPGNREKTLLIAEKLHALGPPHR